MSTLRPLCLFVSVFLMASLAAYSQTTLTGAIEFSTNSSGGASGALLWNTLGGDSYYDLWLAQNPDASLPINGPSDSSADIGIPLQAGSGYRFYIFGQPGPGSYTGFFGLNLFFDGNSSVPALSAFGTVNTPSFLPNGNSSTLTLAGATVPAAGSIAYSSNGVVALLSGYEWHTPETVPGDVCQAKLFAPGDGTDFFGSFTFAGFLQRRLSA